MLRGVSITLNALVTSPEDTSGKTSQKPDKLEATMEKAKRMTVQINKIELQPVNVLNPKTEGIQNLEWPSLEDTDGRFLPNPPDPLHTADTKLRGINTETKAQATPVQILPRPNQNMSALSHKVEVAQNVIPRPQTGAQIKRKNSKQRQYETKRYHGKSSR
jgi:hypothetical protein